MNKILIALVIALTLVVGVMYINKSEPQVINAGSTAVNRYTNIPTTASSTVFTVTTASQRLLATTTSPYNRVAARIAIMGCTVADSRLHLNIKDDVVATTATAPIILASTTSAIEFNTYNNPVNNGSVQGIVNAGTCTVSVTEWVALR